MIEKNLKVGDTFEDGGRTFEVIEIVPQGYISRIKETKTEEVKPKRRSSAKKE